MSTSSEAFFSITCWSKYCTEASSFAARARTTASSSCWIVAIPLSTYSIMVVCTSLLLLLHWDRL